MNIESALTLLATIRNRIEKLQCVAKEGQPKTEALKACDELEKLLRETP